MPCLIVSSGARLPLAALTSLLIAGLMPTVAEATIFQLTGSNVVIDQPAPLFTSNNVTGTLTLADTVLPGASFGSAAIIALTLNFGGITGTLADIKADIAPEDVQAFGTRSLDGKAFSVFDLRFGFGPAVAGCGFFCAGQIVLNSPIGPNDPSNFFAQNDLNGDSLSVIRSFTPNFAMVPEPASWALMIAGFGLIGATLRSSRRVSRERHSIRVPLPLLPVV